MKLFFRRVDGGEAQVETIDRLETDVLDLGLGSIRSTCEAPLARTCTRFISWSMPCVAVHMHAGVRTDVQME